MMVNGITTPVPVVTDIDTSGFWQATARHELAIRVCTECGQVLHVPTTYCHACGSWNTTWKTVRPQGHLYSWTSVHRQIHPAFAVPYTIILVEIDDLPEARLVGHLRGIPDLHPGMSMIATFEELDGATLPVWEPRDFIDPSVETTGANTQ